MFFADMWGRAALERSYQYNFIPFKEIIRFIRYRKTLGFMSVFLNLGGNIVGFIPFGMILPIIAKKCRKFYIVTFLGFDLSLMIESIQLIFKVGSFDVDDIILNTLGGFVGYLLFLICNKFRRKYYG